ncbi:MAG: hypothetical protein M3Y36_08300, partial [Actinomycetota bacterium]|nr:hypothetical protein [Actinomycetota bacterium]
GTPNPGSPGPPPVNPGTRPPPATSPPPQTTQLLNVPGVAVNQPASGGLGVVIGSASAPAAGVTLTPPCTGLQILNIQLGTCQNRATPAPPGLLGGLTGALGNVLG